MALNTSPRTALGQQGKLGRRVLSRGFGSDKVGPYLNALWGLSKIIPHSISTFKRRFRASLKVLGVDIRQVWSPLARAEQVGQVMGPMRLVMACYGGLYGMLAGLTKSTDR